MRNFCHMNKGVFLIITLCMIVLRAGCSSSGVSDSEHPGAAQTSFSRILVSCTGGDSVLNRTLGHSFLREAEGRHIQCVIREQVNIPRVINSKSQLRSLLGKHHIDAVLILAFVGSVPCKKSIDGDLFQFFAFKQELSDSENSRRTPDRVDNVTYTVDGVPIGSGATYLSRLYEVDSGQLVWEYSSTRTREEFVSLDALLVALSGETITKLIQSGVVHSQ